MNDDSTRMTDDLEVAVRSSPRYAVFIATGVIVGFVVAGILVVLPVDSSVLTAEYSLGSALGLLVLLLGGAGATLGAILALFLDWSNSRKARTYTVRGEYLAVHAPRGGSAAPRHVSKGATGNVDDITQEDALDNELGGCSQTDAELQAAGDEPPAFEPPLMDGTPPEDESPTALSNGSSQV